MKIGITGSRSLNNDNVRAFVYRVFDNNRAKIELLISGGALGPDSFSYDYSKETGVDFYSCFPNKYPNYPDKKYDKGSLFKRNSKIVELSDMLLAFYDGESNGAKDTINKGIKSGKKVVVYIFDSITGDWIKTRKHNF